MRIKYGSLISFIFFLNLIIQAQDSALKAVHATEEKRIQVIEKISPTVVCIFGMEQNGGGSGVVFQSGGYVLTNFHVVQAVGLKGLGGLSDGKLYNLDSLGIDPGGDISIVKLTGKDSFAAASLGDSDKVHVGDFALVLGNPFLLAEDYSPSITYGVVSGIKRYQEGEGRILVYGNCIQIDSSINPGNSGGPLFSNDGFVIGINGRGSFEERGRVNVGLGYAISMEQILNFIPDLLATKLCMHGTLDAIFVDQRDGVTCSRINISSALAKAGMSIGDKLIEFDSVKIESANQYTNIISTFPANWPVNIKFKNADEIKSVWVRLAPLPYSTKKEPEEDDEKKEEDKPKKEEDKSKKPIKPIPLPVQNQNPWGQPGEIRDKVVSQNEAMRLFNEFQKIANPLSKKLKSIKYEGKVIIDNKETESFIFTYFSKEKQELEILSEGKPTLSYSLNCFQNLIIAPNKEAQNEDFKLIFEKISFLYGYSLFLNALKEDFRDVSLLGGDKANHRRAYRLKFNENEKTFWNLWLNVVDDDKKFNSQILKLSYSNDKFDSEYGDTASNIQKIDDCLFPMEVNLVYGLEEKRIRQIKLIKVTLE